MIDTLMLLCIVLVSVRVSILSHRVDRNDKDLNDLTKIVQDLWEQSKEVNDFEARLIARKIKKELEK